eukprot:3267398-Rhodomonas_salina.1
MLQRVCLVKVYLHDNEEDVPFLSASTVASCRGSAHMRWKMNKNKKNIPPATSGEILDWIRRCTK